MRSIKILAAGLWTSWAFFCVGFCLSGFLGYFPNSELSSGVRVLAAAGWALMAWRGARVLAVEFGKAGG